PYKVIKVHLDIEVEGYRPLPEETDLSGNRIEDRHYFEAHQLPLDWPACLGCSICVGTSAPGSTAGPSAAGGRLSCQGGSSRPPQIPGRVTSS
ncbi:MAG: hypothetical protein WCF05_16165, partial [Chromatiaceae bacterium]